MMSKQYTNHYIDFQHVDEKGKPLKIWENLAEVLKVNNVSVVYNEITKDIEIQGMQSKSLNNQLIEIHSLSSKCGLKLPINTIGSFINHIGSENIYNPVVDYLKEWHTNFDGKQKYIQMLCDALITPKDYSKKVKEMLIKKWLLNTANIVFNDGNFNIEGILTLQGNQGIGKTRLIRKIIPMYVKTGLELDPSDKDKIYQCIKYWVCELGELDATLKRDLAKLKAFITETQDEFRRPYATAPIKYPRMTSFYATVNNDEFLKDETGNRRYWVIAIDKIDFDIIDKIDINQLWGEVMYMREHNLIKPYLNKEEIEMLNKSNEEFKIRGKLEVIVSTVFDWSAPKSTWVWKDSNEIMCRLKLGSNKGLKKVIESLGGKAKKIENKRGYEVPPYRTVF